MIRQDLMAQLWWGRFRRVFEPTARRLFGKKERVLTGPLQDVFFSGGLAQILGIYEIHVQKVFVSALRPGFVMYDVGANNGYFSLIAAKLVGKNGKVYAFEPYPPNSDKLNNNISKNKFSNIFLNTSAVSDSVGNTHLYVNINSATPSLVSYGLESKIDVSQITLDKFISTHEIPDFIKVDVEGMEKQVLSGAQDLLARAKPSWVIEAHSRENEKEVIDLLSKHNYEIEVLKHPRMENKLYPRNLWARGSVG
jgi:FkbM family methyltransferase